MTRLTIFKNRTIAIKSNDDGTTTSTIGEHSATHKNELQASFNAWQAAQQPHNGS